MADIVDSTKLAAAGRDRDVSFIAGGAVAVLGEAARRGDKAVARQFGGDGAIAAVPPDRLEATRAALAALGRVVRAIDACTHGREPAPLGDGTPLLPRLMPSLAALIVYVVHLCGGRFGAIDIGRYRRDMAERSDHRKAAGGPRLVLDVSEDAATRIEAVLAVADAAGEIRYGTARADATTVTCLVGDFAADRHVHFVDGSGLGFWRASEMLKAKKPAGV